VKRGRGKISLNTDDYIDWFLNPLSQVGTLLFRHHIVTSIQKIANPCQKKCRRKKVESFLRVSSVVLWRANQRRNHAAESFAVQPVTSTWRQIPQIYTGLLVPWRDERTGTDVVDGSTSESSRWSSSSVRYIKTWEVSIISSSSLCVAFLTSF